MAFNLVVEIKNGLDYEDTQRKIEKILGRHSDGSGFGFGIRDLSFYYEREAHAIKALKKINKAKLQKTKAKVIFEEF